MGVTPLERLGKMIEKGERQLAIAEHKASNGDDDAWVHMCLHKVRLETLHKVRLALETDLRKTLPQYRFFDKNQEHGRGENGFLTHPQGSVAERRRDAGG